MPSCVEFWPARPLILSVQADQGIHGHLGLLVHPLRQVSHYYLQHLSYPDVLVAQAVLSAQCHLQQSTCSSFTLGTSRFPLNGYFLKITPFLILLRLCVIDDPSKLFGGHKNIPFSLMTQGFLIKRSAAQRHGASLNAGCFVDRTFCIRRFVDKLGRFVDRCINRSDTWL